jgi:superfamily II DNA or RNA helicase
VAPPRSGGSAALARLHPQPGDPPLLVVATGPYIGEGFDCPTLDTLFLAAPVGYKDSIVQWAGRILRAHPGKTTAEIHDYHDIRTRARRAPGQARSRLHAPRLPRPPPGRLYATTRQLMQPIPA